LIAIAEYQEKIKKFESWRQARGKTS